MMVRARVSCTPSLPYIALSTVPSALSKFLNPRRSVAYRSFGGSARSQSDRLGDDNAMWAAERLPIGLAPAGLAQPRLGVVLAISLTLARDDQELA